jgi:hypothetical protein
MEAAAVEIGLSLTEFYALTPHRFFNLYDRFVDREIRHARQANILSVLYANSHRDQQARSTPFTLDDFAPALRGSEVARNGPKPKPFDGPAFLRPCDECGTPKWQGHLADCQTGQRQFQGMLDKTTRAVERMHEQAAEAGKGHLVPRQ